MHIARTEEAAPLKVNIFDKESGVIIARTESPGAQPDPELGSYLKTLIVVERRDLLRDCLASWLANACPEFETVALPGIDCEATHDKIQCAAAVLLGAGERAPQSNFLQDQIDAIRLSRKDVPIVLVGEPDMHAAEDFLTRLDLQGYIPNTLTSEIAAAALRLVAAGGVYIPYLRQSEIKPNPPSMTGGLPIITPHATALLTPREQKVLECLRRGTPNKIIAYELNISIGTVKLHVHNIIAKLKVHNRTEAALAMGNHVDGNPMSRPIRYPNLG